MYIPIIDICSLLECSQWLIQIDFQSKHRLSYGLFGTRDRYIKSLMKRPLVCPSCQQSEEVIVSKAGI